MLKNALVPCAVSFPEVGKDPTSSKIGSGIKLFGFFTEILLDFHRVFSVKNYPNSIGNPKYWRHIKADYLTALHGAIRPILFWNFGKFFFR
jgi:hypothetical protein